MCAERTSVCPGLRISATPGPAAQFPEAPASLGPIAMRFVFPPAAGRPVPLQPVISILALQQCARRIARIEITGCSGTGRPAAGETKRIAIGPKEAGATHGFAAGPGVAEIRKPGQTLVRSAHIAFHHLARRRLPSVSGSGGDYFAHHHDQEKEPQCQEWQEGAAECPR